MSGRTARRRSGCKIPWPRSAEALEFKRAVERDIARAQHADALRAKAGELHRLAAKDALEADRSDGQALTVAAAMERYALHMAHDKGNKPRTIATTMHRLRGLAGQ